MLSTRVFPTLQVKRRLEQLNKLEGRVYALREHCSVLQESKRVSKEEAESMLTHLEALEGWVEDYGHKASLQEVIDKANIIER